MTKNEPIDQDQNLIQWEYQNNVEQDSTYSFDVIKSNEVKDQWLNEKYGASRKGENNQNHNGLKY